ncbi:alpha/beta hydrolase [Pseudorhodoferax sp. Leaf274]|uniref:RBBP9/YdeN family alpha/beta hydrolase n=1 Tax=Pseudorhodoferax sp. Leaf274 TaxID=1736318 RepID=UPI00070254D1|nr:alpha/beta fold hydrolase [Pseudorhodoferax sp. Leaf274]KQP49538.1 alpha/beta hydrolase [Pseudorhodoferax sp. Leaf274]
MSVGVLTLPGWQGSGPGHWQTLWEQRHGDRRVEQHDWTRPLRGDWLARLDEVLLGLPQEQGVVLAAHSLGCIQVAAWADHSRLTARVRGALLVAPGDVEREDLRVLLPGWAPIVRRRLPFRSLLLGSRNDPYCTQERAQAMARDWGATYHDMGAGGHLNAASGLGDWPAARALLEELRKE